MVDITDLTTLHQTLEASEERLRLLAADLVTVGDDQGRIQWASDAVEQVTGWRRQQLAGQTLSDLVHPDDEAPMRNAVSGTSHGRTEVVRVRVRLADQTWRWFELRIRPVPGADSAATQMAAWRDVHDEVEAQHALERSRRRFASMFHNHDAVMLLVEPVSGEIVDANAAAARFYGYAIDELRAMTIDRLNVLPLDEIRDMRSKAMDNSVNTFTFPHRLASGTIRQVEVHSSPIEEDDRTLLFSIVRDVTDLVASRRLLQANEERLRLDVEQAPVAMITLSLGLAILDANSAAEELLDRPSGGLRGRHIADLIRPAYRAAVPTLTDLLDEPRIHERELRLATGAGRTDWVLVRFNVIRHADDTPSHVVAQMIDVNQFIERQNALTHQAMHDPLTGLANRKMLFETLDHELRRARRHRDPIVVLFCDIDRFKQINDLHGHHVGDIVLRAIGQRLSAVARSTDRVVRLGGDEFVVLPDDIDTPDDAIAFADRILQGLRAPIDVGEPEPMIVTASIGAVYLAAGQHDDVTAHDILQQADAAMYQAKHRGGNTITIDAT